MKNLYCILFVFITSISLGQMNRGMGRTPQIPNSNSQKKVDPKEAALNYLKKELNLDTFQEAATKTFIEENIKEREFILGLDISDADKIEKLTISNDKMYTQMNTILNENQKVLLEKLKDKKSGDKKKKSKKDKKEEKDELILEEN